MSVFRQIIEIMDLPEEYASQRLSREISEKGINPHQATLEDLRILAGELTQKILLEAKRDFNSRESRGK